MDQPDEQLLGQARAGDDRALGALLEAYRGYVRAVVRGACGGRQAAGANDSDIVQDVMLIAARAFATFRGTTVGEFLAWLRQIAVRATYHTLRGADPAGPPADTAEWAADVPCDAPGPPDQAIRQEQAAAVAVAIAGLPEDMQQVLLYRLVDQLDHADIAARMNRTPGAVRMLYLRAIRRLRETYRE